MDLNAQECSASGKSKSTPTADEFCLGTGLESFSGTTCEPSHRQKVIGPSMSFAAGSPVRTSATQGNNSDWKESEADCSLKSSAWFAKYDHQSSCWRTSQRCLIEGWARYSDRWPRAGLMQHGTSYPLPYLARHISDNESLSLPTPVKYDATPGGPNNHYKGLGNLAKHEWTNGDGTGLCPNFVEWLMGFPIGWTALEPLETP